MNKQTEQSNLFNRILLQVIDDVLAAIGDSTKNMIYLLLSKQKGIDRDQIPDRIEEFHVVLEGIFGVGVFRVEGCFLQLLELKLNIRCPASLDGKPMGDCVGFLRQEYDGLRLSQ